VTTDLDEYRHELRTWLAGNVRRYEGADPDLDTHISPERMAYNRTTQAALYDAGYAGFTFPTELGGQSLTLAHEAIFREEIVGYDVPYRVFSVSINILGATLAEFGTPEQQDHVRRILRGEELWLQLLSEPGGGSDLAGLLTSAVRDGDEFVLNGSKTWSSQAHRADWAICPVRTSWDVPKHKGISVFMLDLRTPGIEIRQITEITGEAHFCEEFLTDVRVPASCLLGEENEGWGVLRSRSSTRGSAGAAPSEVTSAPTSTTSSSSPTSEGWPTTSVCAAPSPGCTSPSPLNAWSPPASPTASPRTRSPTTWAAH
jgi:alkylation response protein AidB-like acyl-CoA dehydrogenase